MTELSFDYVAAQKALDIGDMADTKSLAKIARVHAQATVDIAASLAMIVELMQRSSLTGERVDIDIAPVVAPRPEPEPEPDGYQEADNAEPGDTVALAASGISAPLTYEVLEVGTTEGEVWLKLDGVKGKKWARDYVIVERGVGGDFE